MNITIIWFWPVSALRLFLRLSHFVSCCGICGRAVFYFWAWSGHIPRGVFLLSSIFCEDYSFFIFVCVCALVCALALVCCGVGVWG